MIIKNLIIAILSVSLLTSCSTNRYKETRQLKFIISNYTQEYKSLDAFNAPYFNVESQLGQFGDYLTPEQVEREKALIQKTLNELRNVKTDELEESDLLLYQMFKNDLALNLEYHNYKMVYLDHFNQMGNRLRQYLDDSSPELTSFPFDSVKHYNDFVERSKGFPDFIDRQITKLKEAINHGYTHNCVVAKSAMKTYQDGLEPNYLKHPFYRPVANMPAYFTASDKQQITDAFASAVKEKIIPSFKKFDVFYKGTYLPKCRSTYGIYGLPDADKMYAYKIKRNTDSEMEATQIHEIGLNEVARIKDEFLEIMKKRNFNGTFAQFLKSLTQDEQFYFKTEKDMFAAFTQYKSKIDNEIPKYFDIIPKSEFQIVSSENSEDAAASYRMPTDFKPVAKFVVNTKNIKGVPTYGVETLYLHEAIPGHHFQLAIQFERKRELTEYQRKILDSTAFIEGWALYAERLGREEGWISSDLQTIGSLSDEMLRAVRLVVDTGIHHYGWTRSQAIQYMKDHLASDIRDIEIEADRYSVWPGQALAYKMGQLKILQLRERAKKKLGDKFNIKDFHNVVLRNGTVTLQALETAVNTWSNQ